MHFYCGQCGRTYPVAGLDYQCACGGLFRLRRDEGETIPAAVSLGEMETPLIRRSIGGIDVGLKLDYLRPTGSFKDRGAFALINALKAAGIEEVVEDSSGNAGAAIAGYCAAAGIRCNIYLPEATSAGKIKQITAYGAQIVKVPGGRDDTSRAVLAAARRTYYASHVYNPLFFEGTKSLAYELYRQVGVPDYIFVPTGNGTMLLGLYLGFQEIGVLPKLIAVQSKNCMPVYNEFHRLPPTPVIDTAAEGIAIGRPMRARELIAAVQESGGDFVAVDDAAVVAAQRSLARMGVYTEVTSGAAVAGLLEYFAGRDPAGCNIVAPLTGMGLKK